MSFELIILAVAVLGNLTIAAFVFNKNSSSSTNRILAFLAVSISAWSIANYFSLRQTDLNATLVSVRIVMFFAVLMNYGIFLVLHAFPKQKSDLSRKWFNISTVLTVVVAALALSPLLFSSVTVKGGSIQPNPGPAIPLFMIQTIGLVGSGFVSVLRKFRRAVGREKVQVRFLLFGVIITVVLIILSNFVAPLVFKTSAFVKLGPAYTLVFISSIAYAIIRHRLFDIRAVVAKSVAFSLLIGTMAVLYGIAIFATTQFIFPDSTNSAAQTGSYTALAIILALTFQPLRRFFEQITDKIFFRDRYDAQVVLDNLSKILVSEIDLGEMLQKALAQLCTDMRIDFGQLIIFNNDVVYRMEHYGKLPQRLIVAPQLRKLNHSMIVADELDGGEKKEIMDDHGIRVSAILRTRDELVGYLILGDKLSGEIYSHDDIELLQIVAKELAVASQNAKAYAEIQAFNLTLQERVAHATNRLRVANRHLKELDQAKDEFISMASHQLRTPLTTIKGYLSMMLEGDAGEISPMQKQFTGYAFEGADRMVNLIADLLNVSRLSAGRFMIEARPSDLGKIVEDEVRQLQSHAAAKKLELIYHAPKRALPMIPLDDNKTRQVIMNFVDNAIYYTKEGSITVTVTKVDSAVRVTVRDTGIGVPLDARHKLFSKFYRADNAQTVRPDGTGLGLYLAKRVIEDQGGTIIFESVEGKGSTFGFELPLVSKPVSEPPTKKVPTPS